MELMEGLHFKIGPKSFYQTNSEQAYELYKLTREMAELKPHETLYDLYTGTGTPPILAAQCAKVVGVEYVERRLRMPRSTQRITISTIRYSMQVI